MPSCALLWLSSCCEFRIDSVSCVSSRSICLDCFGVWCVKKNEGPSRPGWRLAESNHGIRRSCARLAHASRRGHCVLVRPFEFLVAEPSPSFPPGATNLFSSYGADEAWRPRRRVHYCRWRPTDISRTNIADSVQKATAVFGHPPEEEVREQRAEVGEARGQIGA